MESRAEGTEEPNPSLIAHIGPSLIFTIEGTVFAIRHLYIARFAETIYVLHAFHKKARATSERDIELAKTRYAELR